MKTPTTHKTKLIVISVGLAVSTGICALIGVNMATITQMKATNRAFTLASDLNPGETGLTSAPLSGKQGGELLTANEYNRVLELVSQRGSTLPGGCDDGQMLIYQASTSTWNCATPDSTDTTIPPAETCTSTQISADEIKTVCEYTGGDQIVTAPDGYTTAEVKVWGAGGGGHSYEPWSSRSAASGGYTEAEFSISGGNNYLVVVGEGGKMNSSDGTYGGGGAGGSGIHNPPSIDLNGGSGGGLSGLFLSTSLSSSTSADAMVIAGGGGAVPGCVLAQNTGVGGGTSGGAGYNNTNSGGTQTGGGGGGSGLFIGGNGGDEANTNGGGGGGGGGGYYGGGGGNGGVGICSMGSIPGGGGGGSGYCASSLLSCTTNQGINTIPPAVSDADYKTGVGTGGVAKDGGNGLVVIRWKKTPTLSLPHTCLDVSQTQIVDRVSAQTGAIWMDRNLGASRAATSIDDPLAYGCLFSWGRGEDGHEKIQWTNTNSGTAVNGVTSTKFSSDTPGSSLFVEVNGDWRNPRNDGLWQGLNGTNNICPTGYRLPTEAELTAEGLSSITDAYSKLGFTRAGKRNENPERVENQDDFGSYWSSTIDADESRRIKLDNNSDWTSGSRANGFSVRCIKD